MATLRQRLKKHGFTLSDWHREGTAYIRSDGEVDEVITLADEPEAPTRLSDHVTVFIEDTGVRGAVDEESATMRRVLAALDDRRKEYHLLTLRLYNGYGKR